MLPRPFSILSSDRFLPPLSPLPFPFTPPLTLQLHYPYRLWCPSSPPSPPSPSSRRLRRPSVPSPSLTSPASLTPAPCSLTLSLPCRSPTTSSSARMPRVPRSVSGLSLPALWPLSQRGPSPLSMLISLTHSLDAALGPRLHPLVHLERLGRRCVRSPLAPWRLAEALIPLACTRSTSSSPSRCRRVRLHRDYSHRSVLISPSRARLAGR